MLCNVPEQTNNKPHTDETSDRFQEREAVFNERSQVGAGRHLAPDSVQILAEHIQDARRHDVAEKQKSSSSGNETE